MVGNLNLCGCNQSGLATANIVLRPVTNILQLILSTKYIATLSQVVAALTCQVVHIQLVSIVVIHIQLQYEVTRSKYYSLNTPRLKNLRSRRNINIHLLDFTLEGHVVYIVILASEIDIQRVDIALNSHGSTTSLERDKSLVSESEELSTLKEQILRYGAISTCWQDILATTSYQSQGELKGLVSITKGQVEVVVRHIVICA